jgi:hypothetical protein
LGSFLQIKEIAQIIGLLISAVYIRFVFILTKNGLGYILGDPFTKTSGHPDLGQFFINSSGQPAALQI